MGERGEKTGSESKCTTRAGRAGAVSKHERGDVEENTAASWRGELVALRLPEQA